MKKIIKWGILGSGKIAHKFVNDLKTLEDAEVFAVGSRTIEKATAFSQEFGIPKKYGSYEELLKDADVQIIYVATPHHAHKEDVMKCLRAGKAVLCEKPFTINADETEEIIKYARESKLFLMEAMWTRFLPAIVKLRELLKSGIIGDIRQVKADFGFRCEWNTENRLLNPELGGGALLDVGIYVISFAVMIFGVSPLKISTMPYIGSTGIDEQFSATLGFDEGKMAILTGAVRTKTPQDAWVIGTEGYIHIPDFWHAKSIILYLQGKPAESFDMPFESLGYQYEASEAMNCLREGKLESDIMSLNETLTIMKIMDNIRNQWELKYPFE